MDLMVPIRVRISGCVSFVTELCCRLCTVAVRFTDPQGSFCGQGYIFPLIGCLMMELLRDKADVWLKMWWTHGVNYQVR